MAEQVTILMCQASETDRYLGLTWHCVLPMHDDKHHYFEVIKIHTNIIPEQE